MRKNQTQAENWLWQQLRDRRLAGHKFRRQRVIGPYIVDFVCLETFVIIELDGSQHLAQKDYDEQRSDYLASQGFRVLRFWNDQVFKQPDAVLEAIYEATLTPTLSR